MRPAFTWRLRTRALELGPRTLVMGVVNVTPDSFSDGGLYLDPHRAAEFAVRLLDEGADIIDVGGESTRPGARAGEEPRVTAQVTVEDEQRRVVPAIREVLRRRPDAVISVDTYKAEVARAVVEAGAEIVNDVSGGAWDAAMLPALAALDCGCVLMHTRGRPHEWRTLPPAGDILALVAEELSERARAALAAGIERDRIVLDPGFGFGKNFGENYPLIAGFGRLAALGFPLMAGPSRKSFLGRILARDGHDRPARDRLYGTLAATTACILNGAHIVRTHDVAPAVDAARIADAVLAAQQKMR